MDGGDAAAASDRWDRHDWWGVVLDAPDVAVLAKFYSELRGWAVYHQDDDDASLDLFLAAVAGVPAGLLVRHRRPRAAIAVLWTVSLPALYPPLLFVGDWPGEDATIPTDLSNVIAALVGWALFVVAAGAIALLAAEPGDRGTVAPTPCTRDRRTESPVTNTPRHRTLQRLSPSSSGTRSTGDLIAPGDTANRGRSARSEMAGLTRSKAGGGSGHHGLGGGGNGNRLAAPGGERRWLCPGSTPRNSHRGLRSPSLSQRTKTDP
jgi:hypothetical protein